MQIKSEIMQNPLLCYQTRTNFISPLRTFSEHFKCRRNMAHFCHHINDKTRFFNNFVIFSASPQTHDVFCPKNRHGYTGKMTSLALYTDRFEKE